MNWDVWFRVPISAHGGDCPRSLIEASEDRFQALLAHLQRLIAMLEPGGAIPPAGLLNLPLEAELNARIAEKRPVLEHGLVESEQPAPAKQVRQSKGETEPKTGHSKRVGEAHRNRDARVQRIGKFERIRDWRHRFCKRVLKWLFRKGA